MVTPDPAEMFAVLGLALDTDAGAHQPGLGQGSAQAIRHGLGREGRRLHLIGGRVELDGGRQIRRREGGLQDPVVETSGPAMGAPALRTEAGHHVGLR
jgi:hypothetical protein